MSFNESAFGWDGLSTFIFSNVILLSTAGIWFFWLFFRTLKIAKNTSLLCTNNTNKLLIAGLRLDNDQPTDEFKTRLNRVINLIQQQAIEQDVQVIILGGLTGNNRVSEARSGADYLLAHGLNAEQIILEDQSRHTLENLQNARVLLEQSSSFSSKHKAAIITSRYHLYRVTTLAKGLSLTLAPISAEDEFHLSFINLLRLFKEAYYLHWYWSGKMWVLVTANKKSQARIS